MLCRRSCSAPDLPPGCLPLACRYGQPHGSPGTSPYARPPGGPAISARHDTAALIVAAGRGQRMGTEQPKQYLDLGGQTVLARTLQQVLKSEVISRVQVVIHADDRALYDAAMADLSDQRIGPPVSGGATRSESVQRGLQALAWEAPDHVLIHDAARPFVSPDLIARIRAALDATPGAFAAVPMVDALWSSQNGRAQDPVSRDGLWRAQTPQGFRFEDILSAHDSGNREAADDVEIARAAGLEVALVEGTETNFKITTLEDMARALIMLNMQD